MNKNLYYRKMGSANRTIGKEISKKYTEFKDTDRLIENFEK